MIYKLHSSAQARMEWNIKDRDLEGQVRQNGPLTAGESMECTALLIKSDVPMMKPFLSIGTGRTPSGPGRSIRVESF